jgi:hypothetical protein
MAAELVPLGVERPGITKAYSRLSTGNRWIDGDKVRFVDRFPQKIGGWIKRTLASVVDPIRGMQAWSTITLLSYIGFGTHRRLYIADQTLVPFNITPFDEVGTLTGPFTTTLGSNQVKVTDPAHGRKVGDTVIFGPPPASYAVGGLTISGEYTIVAIVDENNYIIEDDQIATSNATGGGTVGYQYELSTGAIEPFEGNGYGTGPYGINEDGYGMPTQGSGGGLITSILVEPRIWSLEPYGNLLLANPSGGGIYQFDPTVSPSYQRAQRVANAPLSVRSIFVTPERFLMALGADNDPMKIRWPDQNVITEWNPTEVNSANIRRLQEGSRLMGGCGLADGLSAVLTDTALYRFQYTGGNFIFSSELAGTNCGLISPLALVAHQGVAFWMSPSGFLMWGGGGSPQPITNSEDVREWVRLNIRTAGYEFKANAHLNTRFNEIWWFFVPNGQEEPSYYVAVSLQDFSWVTGTMVRCSGTFFKGSDQRPLLGGADGWVYQHEDGVDADGELMPSFLKRAPLRVQNGGRISEILGVRNDFHRQIGEVSIEIQTYDQLNEGVIDTEKTSFDPGEDMVDFRIGGRIADFTIKSAELGGDFRLGEPQLEVRIGGRRRG